MRFVPKTQPSKSTSETGGMAVAVIFILIVFAITGHVYIWSLVTGVILMLLVDAWIGYTPVREPKVKTEQRHLLPDDEDE